MLCDARQHTGSGEERSSLTLDQITRLQPAEHIVALEQFLAAEVAWLQDAVAGSIDLDGSVAATHRSFRERGISIVSLEALL